MCDVSEGEILIIITGSQCNGQRNVWWQKCAAVFWEAFRFWQKLCKNKIMMCNLSFFGDSLNNTTQRRSRKERKLGEKINFVELFGQFFSNNYDFVGRFRVRILSSKKSYNIFVVHYLFELWDVKIGQRTKAAFQISWICMNENQLWM